MECKRYKINYGRGTAYLYTPYEPEDRFYTLADTCFGIRKCIERCDIMATENWSLCYDHHERLEFSGDAYVWRKDGARKMITPFPDEDWDEYYCDKCKYKGEEEMKKVIEESGVNVATLPYIPEDYLTQAGNKALAEKIQAMDETELEIVVDNIPVELCLKRIQKELERNKKLVEALRGVSIML